MDLVYIVKKSEVNNELRYSLRSIAKFIPNANIWIVGYKPTWVKNVNYLPTEQTGDKWKNSIHNIIAACECPDISEDFILMNDDFFAIRPIDNLEKSIDVSLGLLSDSIVKHEKKSSNWHKAFKFVDELLKDLNVQGPYYDYETHMPLKINKEKYLIVMNLIKVKEFMKTDKILHKRTLYKNIEKGSIPKVLKHDVKILKDSDVSDRVKICDWISIADNQIKNVYFPNLNKFLETLMLEPCKYETGDIINTVKPISSIKKEKFKF